MQKPTLLQIVQDILNDLSGDEISTTNDTIESIQVKAIVQSTFYNMMTTRDWPHTRQLFQPTNQATAQLPTHFSTTDSLKELTSVYYNKSQTSQVEYLPVKYFDPDQFLRYTNSRNTLDTTNVMIVTDPSGIQLNIAKNYAPTCYTSFDDVQLVFDSFNQQVEAWLDQTKFQMYGYIIPDWVDSDTAIVDLPIEAFPQLIEEAKSACAVKLRQQPDQKAEQEAERQRKWMARKDWTIAGGIKFPDYGRRGRYMQYVPHRDPTFRNGN